MALSCLNRGEFKSLRFGKGPNRSDFASWTGICTGYGSTAPTHKRGTSQMNVMETRKIIFLNYPRIIIVRVLYGGLCCIRQIPMVISHFRNCI